MMAARERWNYRSPNGPVPRPQSNMQNDVIQRQYDEVIAAHYDLDPHDVIGRSLDRAIDQILRQGYELVNGAPLRALDLGMGTGAFFERLQRHADRLEPYGIDISEKMIDVARARVRNLVAAV